jgi:hypothetical protein
MAAPGGTYTLAADLVLDATHLVTVNQGTIAGGQFNVTAQKVAGNSSTAGNISIGSGIWSLIGTGSLTVWDLGSVTTVTPGSGIISIDSTDSGVTKTFIGRGATYPTLRHRTTGTAALTITGNNTISLELDSSSARTVTIPTGTSIVTPPGGKCSITGLITLTSATPGTKATIDAQRAQNVNVLVPLSSDIVLLRSAPPGSRRRR